MDISSRIGRLAQLTPVNSEGLLTPKSGYDKPAYQNWQQSTRVDISPEAKEKLAQEDDFKLAEVLNTSVEELEIQDSSSSTEKLIKVLKEKIAELNKQIAALAAKGDESAEEQLKAMELELASLNAQLLALISNELSDLKTS